MLYFANTPGRVNTFLFKKDSKEVKIKFLFFRSYFIGWHETSGKEHFSNVIIHFESGFLSLVTALRQVNLFIDDSINFLHIQMKHTDFHSVKKQQLTHDTLITDIFSYDFFLHI